MRISRPLLPLLKLSKLKIDMSKSWEGYNIYDIATLQCNILNTKDIIRLGIKREVLREFDDPKVLICTSSMNEVLNSADKVEYQPENITANSQELSIVGGSATEKGISWIYWNLPYSVKKCYIKGRMCNVNAQFISFDFCDADGSTYDNPPNWYRIDINVSKTNHDFEIYKSVSGSISEVSYEAVDLAYDTLYDVEFYADLYSGNLKAWRNGIQKFNVYDGNIKEIVSVRMLVTDDSTSEVQQGKFRGPLVVIYE